MPHIVVERYNSGRFATNAAATEAYQRALGMISSSTGPAVVDLANTGNAFVANNTNLSPAQLQAVSQAVAAQTRGGNVAIANGSQGTGARDAPIHVVVDQPFGDRIFRWIKFFFWFALTTYLALIFATLAIDSASQIRRVAGGRQDNEVRSELQKTRFADVHGCDEAVEELKELVEFLKNPEAFSRLGGKLPKGIMLVGPPGTGKTLLARAVAGEAGVPFFYMSGSEFDEIYVGVGAKRVRDLFAGAKAKAPSIVFIDELDAIGSKRNERDASYVRQTLNQLLTELDGFEQDSGVIVIGATNFPESLDKALTRPGRFDRHVQVDLPDVRGRIAILNHHAQKIKAAPGVNLQAIAQQTSGLSGAELESIVNQAAVHASKMKSAVVTKADFDWAKDKVIMGAEKKSMVISAHEKEMTAYHEAGHALVNLFTVDGPRKLYKVTILPRGRSLGHTSFLPEMDRYSMTAKDFLSMIDASLGGKLAEEIQYGTEMTTSGVSSVSYTSFVLVI
jgi:ATP-dependent metalloprotease